MRRPGTPIEPIVGESPALKRQLKLLQEFAGTEVPIYIFGETGTGKELVARSVHQLSPRAAGPFIAQNCAAIPDTLLQSLLFGHRRGAFTGADRDQLGVFAAANAGTLFLDEIGEMSTTLQGALLRVLQEKEFTRLGDVHPTPTEVRIISASNRPLEHEIEEGRFRRDLFFRLVTLRIDMPTLRERRSDVPLLVDYFIRGYNLRTRKNIAGIDPAALAVLHMQPWPGNVRQLQAEVERACILTTAGERISLTSLSPQCALLHGAQGTVHGEEADRSRGRSLPDILGAVERSLLVEALQQAAGNKTEAARLLGVSRQRLTQRLQRWSIGGST